jgi:ADP-heptose:LPS heptosyltransferase
MIQLPDSPRLLIARTDRVGDVIISTSCLAPLRQRFPHGTFYFMARPVMAPILTGHPELAGFLARSVGHSGWEECGRLTQQLRELRLDAMVQLHQDGVVTLAARRAGIPHRLGYGQGITEWTLSVRGPDRRREGLKHEARYNFDLLQPLQMAEPVELSPSIFLPPDVEASFKNKPQRLPVAPGYVVINLTAHSPIARWPASAFAELTRRIWSELGLEVVLIGSQRNDPSRLEYLSYLGNDAARVHDWTEQTDMAELGYLLKNARALVTRDTGPSHLAAAVGCPVLVLFGRTSPLYGPTRWRPLGKKVSVLLSPSVQKKGERREHFWKRSFAEIKISDVFRDLALLLQ